MADDEHAELRQRVQRELDEQARRWSQWLVVGNGGAAVLMGGALVKGISGPLWLAVLPAMWCFVIGLLAAAGSAYARMRQHEYWGYMLATSKGDVRELPPDKFHLWFAHGDKSNAWDTVSRRLEATASGLFGAGVLWPLAAMTTAIHWQ